MFHFSCGILPNQPCWHDWQWMLCMYTTELTWLSLTKSRLHWTASKMHDGLRLRIFFPYTRYVLSLVVSRRIEGSSVPCYVCSVCSAWRHIVESLQLFWMLEKHAWGDEVTRSAQCCRKNITTYRPVWALCPCPPRSSSDRKVCSVCTKCTCTGSSKGSIWLYMYASCFRFCRVLEINPLRMVLFSLQLWHDVMDTRMCSWCQEQAADNESGLWCF